MNELLKIFGSFLIQRFGCEPLEVKGVPSLYPDLPPVYVFVFRDYPDKNLTTFVTYGLSEVTHPTWHFGRPELLLSVESEKMAWGVGLAFVVNQFRGEKLFSLGSVYRLDCPIIEESGMSGFVIFKPSFLTLDDSILQLSGKTVYLTQAYPIYPGEADLIAEKGFESFWLDERLVDVYDVGREEVG